VQHLYREGRTGEEGREGGRAENGDSVNWAFMQPMLNSPTFSGFDRFGLFAWQLFSHKLLRYLAFGFMTATLLSSILPARHSWTYVFLMGRRSCSS
jgi:hypothetical protein